MAAMKDCIKERTLVDGSKRYDVALTFHDQATGKRILRWKTFSSKREAKAARAENQVQRAHGMDAPESGMRLTELLTEWLAKKKAAVAPSTYVTYRTTVDKHIRPYLGAKRVAQITPRMVEQHYTKLRSEGLGPVALKNVHCRLADVFRYARRQRLISASPIEDVDRPKTPEHEHHIWNDDEMRRVLAVTGQSSYGPIWLVALHTGMRRGELLGLRWQDVDPEAGVLHVKQQMSRVGGNYVAVPPKRGSYRSITVPLCVFDALRRHRMAQNERKLAYGGKWQSSDLVFTARFGTPINERHVMEDLRRIVELAAVPPITVHDVRHTHGSMLMRRGKSPREVAERLGHKRASITLDTYTHAVPEEHKQTARDLERWLA